MSNANAVSANGSATLEKQIFNSEEIHPVLGYPTARALIAAINRGQCQLKVFRRGKAIYATKAAIDAEVARITAVVDHFYASDSTHEAPGVVEKLAEQSKSVVQTDDAFLMKYLRKTG